MESESQYQKGDSQRSDATVLRMEKEIVKYHQGEKISGLFLVLVNVLILEEVEDQHGENYETNSACKSPELKTLGQQGFYNLNDLRIAGDSHKKVNNIWNIL